MIVQMMMVKRQLTKNLYLFETLLYYENGIPVTVPFKCENKLVNQIIKSCSAVRNRIIC